MAGIELSPVLREGFTAASYKDKDLKMSNQTEEAKRHMAHKPYKNDFGGKKK